jgi:hypothetical protein
VWKQNTSFFTWSINSAVGNDHINAVFWNQWNAIKTIKSLKELIYKMNYQLLLLLFSLFIHSSSATINFDYFMLAETWPASFCQMQTCISNIPSKFSIHGLWPKNNSSPHTSQCTTVALGKQEVCLSGSIALML